MLHLEFPLVQGEPKVLKIVGWWLMTGMLLSLTGAFLYFIGNSLGKTCLSLGFFLGIFPSIVFSLINTGGRFFPGKMISNEFVYFLDDSIKIAETNILLDNIRTIEAVRFEFKGQPKFSKYDPIYDGTGNYFKIKLKNSEEFFLTFFIANKTCFDYLDKYLHDLKLKKGILIIK